MKWRFAIIGLVAGVGLALLLRHPASPVFQANMANSAQNVPPNNNSYGLWR